MDQVIWKSSVGPNAEYYLSMPRGAEILHADVQDGEFYLWALVE
jgi:hypothetical protein